jgi:hypothetical protein
MFSCSQEQGVLIKGLAGRLTVHHYLGTATGNYVKSPAEVQSITISQIGLYLGRPEASSGEPEFV